MKLSSMAVTRMFWTLLPCLMLLSKVQAEDPQRELPSARSSCPRGSKAYGSYCYALFLTPKSWMEAEIACQKLSSGHLVSVLGAAEGSFVSTLVNGISNSYANIWIGLHDPTMGLEPSAGGWEWSNGDMLHYLSWERDPSTVSNSGHCGTVSRSTRFLKWKDYDCNQRLPYVCKFKD